MYVVLVDTLIVEWSEPYKRQMEGGIGTLLVTICLTGRSVPTISMFSRMIKGFPRVLLMNPTMDFPTVGEIWLVLFH